MQGEADLSISTTAPVQSTLDPVRPFARLGRNDVAYAGGKGANLGELTRAGLPVPDGFVVGAPAYAAFLTQTGLRERLAELLDSVNVEDTGALRAASAAAQALFDETPIPEPLATEIGSAYEQLAGKDLASGDAISVAVRSSATAEDTAATSFAGMNETFLNVRGSGAVIDAVRRCWRSLFGARTIYYRGVNGFAQADMDIAVVVQRQVQSTRAGVMFTVNPATGQRDELVIEGSFGLGEAVVSGSVSPDRYIVEKATLAIRRREVHHKDLVIEPAPHGGTVQRALSEAQALLPVLSDDEVVAVAESGGVSRSTTALRRTPSGHLTLTGRCGCSRAARSPRYATRRRWTRRRRRHRHRRPCCCAAWAERPAAPAAPRACSGRSTMPSA